MKKPPLLAEYLANLDLSQKYSLLAKIYWRKLVAVLMVIWSATVSVYQAMSNPFPTIGNYLTSTETKTIGYICPYCHWEFTSERKFQEHVTKHQQARLQTTEIAATYTCTTCRKQMPRSWDTVCSRCGATSCYSCSVTVDDKWWICQQCAAVIAQDIQQAKQLSRPLYYSYDVSDQVSHPTQRNR